MIVYVSFEVRIEHLWLEDAAAVEAMRLELLACARRLHADRVRNGYPAVESDVAVERLESIGGAP
jgi:hypothetical protein